jgi:hypothetical protein
MRRPLGKGSSAPAGFHDRSRVGGLSSRCVGDGKGADAAREGNHRSGGSSGWGGSGGQRQRNSGAAGVPGWPGLTLNVVTAGRWSRRGGDCACRARGIQGPEGISRVRLSSARGGGTSLVQVLSPRPHSRACRFLANESELTSAGAFTRAQDQAGLASRPAPFLPVSRGAFPP